MSRLFLILGDQLHPDPHPLLVAFDPARDRLLMVEAREESPTSGAIRRGAKRRTGLPVHHAVLELLARHARRFHHNPRLALLLKNLQRFSDAERNVISARPQHILNHLDDL